MIATGFKLRCVNAHYKLVLCVVYVMRLNVPVNSTFTLLLDISMSITLNQSGDKQAIAQNTIHRAAEAAAASPLLSYQHRSPAVYKIFNK